MPPLPARAWRRDPAWLTGLRQLAAALIPVASPAAAISLAALGSDDDEWLESLADQVIDPTGSRRNADLLPYVGAALEVYWTVMASRLAGELAPLDVAGVCPCCGFLPVASVVRADAGNRRYLHCALCNTEWNLVRVTCAACGGVEGIAYQQIEGGDGKLRAETCDGCHGYLKILYGGAQADPVADDLAGLALDLLVDGLGYRRIGPNLLFIPGEA